MHLICLTRRPDLRGGKSSSKVANLQMSYGPQWWGHVGTNGVHTNLQMTLMDPLVNMTIMGPVGQYDSNWP
jgi:hypothetical protein